MVGLAVLQGFDSAACFEGFSLHQARQGFETQPGEEEAAEAELLGLCCHSAIVSTDVPEVITSCFS